MCIRDSINIALKYFESQFSIPNQNNLFVTYKNKRDATIKLKYKRKRKRKSKLSKRISKGYRNAKERSK